MQGPLLPEATIESLQNDNNVFRLIKLSKDGKVSPEHFVLSDKDKDSALQSLSVWAQHLTMPQQALSFIEEGKRSEYQVYALMNVGAIRSLRPLPDSPAIVPYLNVVWDTLRDPETGLVANQPGAIGHFGITGLRREGLNNTKQMYKSLRLKLADLANLHIESISQS